MDISGRRLGWVSAGVVCCALIVGPLEASATEKGEASKESKPPAKESPLVKASREIQAKKTGSAKTYSNEDLQASPPATKVYTNDDLSRMYGSTPESGSSTPTPASPGTVQPGTTQDAPDPLALMEQQQKSLAERDRKIATAESALAAAQARLQNLQKQLLATSNPFAARPELSEEEQEYRETSGETAAERNARTQKMVEEARAAVAEAEADLAKARSE